MGPTGRRGRSRLWCLELIGFRTYRLANLQVLGLIGSPVDHPHPFPLSNTGECVVHHY